MNKDMRYHEAFDIPSKIFKDLGVFNGFIGHDAKFYIVPHMLENTKISGFKQSYKKYKNHFSDIVKLLKQSKKVDDIFYRKVVNMFISPEIAHAGLGYSKSNKKGSGIGPKLAKMLTLSALEIVHAGIEDPEIFELIGLLEEGIGADRISDMLLSILIKDFLQYTNSIAKELKLPTKSHKYRGEIYLLPHYKNQKIIFIPEEFIVGLPIAINRDDISMVCTHNEELRERVNLIIAQGMGHGNKISKPQLKALILSEPEIAKELISLIKEKIKTPYNFNEDPTGKLIWTELAHEFSTKYPIQISKKLSVFEVVKTICSKYQDLIENNGLFKFFHNTDGKHKNETFAQRLFFAISQSYCEANNLDISPESDAGRGPIDFKISQGHDSKVNVELKLSTNNLLHGYKKQLPIYDKAEKTMNSFFLIILLYEKDIKKIDLLYEYKRKNETFDKKLPEIVVVDATMKKSASKS